MTFKEYKAIYGKDGWCSLRELEDIRLNSNPRSYRAIANHWLEAIWKTINEEYPDISWCCQKEKPSKENPD